MFKYYSYYSMSGYKDMYLGNSVMEAENTYFLPLLAYKKKKAQDSGDTETIQSVARADALPKIGIVNQKQSYDIPDRILPLISHGGYKLIYTYVAPQSYALLLRDIIPKDSSESGTNPFLLAIVADEAADVKKLEAVAAYWINNIQETSRKIASFFNFDIKFNGLRFSLSECNAWLQECAKYGNTISVAGGTQKILSKPQAASILIKSCAMKNSELLKELKLTDYKTRILSANQVWGSRSSKSSTKYVIGLAIAFGVIAIIFCLCKSCNGSSKNNSANDSDVTCLLS